MERSVVALLLWAALQFWVLGQMWFAQIVVYPLFSRVGVPDYKGYHRFYAQRIPLPVIAPGFASFLFPIPLFFVGPQVPGWMSGLNIAAGIAGLLVTVLLAIPRHNRLERAGKDERVIAELVRYNWPRTVAVVAQSFATMAMLLHVFGAG